jgi:hypothetical protein
VKRGQRAAALITACAAVGALAGCGSAGPAGSPGPSQAPAAATSLATSLETAADSWAVVPVAADPAFWEVFVRPAVSPDWRLVTPQGVADNGGLVAAGTAGSLVVAVRPDQGLTFSPLATSTDGGDQWNTGLIDAGVAATPGALAASGSELLALVRDGTILASSDSGSGWRTLAGPGALAGSPAGRQCGLRAVTNVSFGIKEGEVLAAGTCGTAGTGVFTYSAGGWQRVSLPVSGQLVRMMPGVVLVASGTRLYAAWETPSGWQASAALTESGVPASGSYGSGGAWVLLAGGRAATIGGPGQPWRSLPLVPRGTVVLAGGPEAAVDALAVSGNTLTVWRLSGSANVWAKFQSIGVPVQSGSSS